MTASTANPKAADGEIAGHCLLARRRLPPQRAVYPGISLHGSVIAGTSAPARGQLANLELPRRRRARCKDRIQNAEVP